MTEQSTPTPTQALESVVRRVTFNVTNFPKAAQSGIIGQNMTPLNYTLTHAIVAAGWKSPAEVAELVRAGAEEAWDQASKARRFGLKNNPHRKPTPETVPSDV